MPRKDPTSRVRTKAQRQVETSLRQPRDRKTMGPGKKRGKTVAAKGGTTEGECFNGFLVRILAKGSGERWRRALEKYAAKANSVKKEVVQEEDGRYRLALLTPKGSVAIFLWVFRALAPEVEANNLSPKEAYEVECADSGSVDNKSTRGAALTPREQA